jgi:hypothetical protein
MAAAPAITIYYSFHEIQSFFKIEKRSNLPSSILRLILATFSLVLINFSTGFNSCSSFGYFLVITGLMSTFILEFALLGHKHFPQKAA